MDNTSTAPAQAEAAPEQTIVTPSPDIASASEALTLAKVTGASDAEIASLQAEVNRHMSAGAAQTQETVETTQEPTEPEPAKADEESEQEGTETTQSPTAGETPQENEVRVSERPRISHLSDEDKLSANAINLLTRKGYSLAEATQRVLGDLTQRAEAPAEPPQKSPEAAAADAEIERLVARQAELKGVLKAAAADDVLFGAEIEAANSELVEVAVALVEKRIEARLAEREAKVVAQQELHKHAEAERSWTEVQGLYPGIADPESAIYLTTAQLAEVGRQNPSHPLHQHSGDPDYVKHCAALAARKLDMVQKTAAPQAVPPAKQQTATAQRPGPASGSRSTAPASPQPTAAQRIAESEAMLNAVLDGDAGAYQVARTGGFVR